MGLLDRWFGQKREVLPVHIEDAATFEREVTRSDRPVIVDVWRDNCAPCRQLAPVLIDMATRYEGRVKFAEVNTSGEPALIRRLGAMATPTILVFRDGREIGRVVGFHPRNWFEEMIDAEFPLPADDR